MIQLSIVVVNWNTRDLLAQCLQSVYNTLQRLTFEILVVDNASTDDSVTMVRERFPQVRLFENRDNVGFARANNQAIRQSTGRYVLLLNSDAQLTKGVANGMVHYLDEQPTVGIVGARVVYPDGRPQFCYGQFPTLWSECLGLIGLHKWDMSHWDDENALEVDWVSGACLMARRECLDVVGLLDERFFMFGEEVDLCYRATKAGWRVALIPCPPVIHTLAGSSGQTPERVLRLYRGKIKYFQKHYGALSQEALCALMVISSFVKMTVYGFWALGDKHRWEKRNLWQAVSSQLLQGHVKGL